MILRHTCRQYTKIAYLSQSTAQWNLLIKYFLDVSLYMVDSSSNELYISPRYVLNGQHKVNWKITAGTTVAAYVAHTKEYIMSEEVLGDPRFPYGIDYKGFHAYFQPLNIIYSLSPRPQIRIQNQCCVCR